MHNLPNNPEAHDVDENIYQSPPQNSTALPEVLQVSTRLSTSSSHIRPSSTNGEILTPERTWTTDLGSRRKVAMALTRMGNFFGTAPREWFDDSEFKRGKALDFPEIPGEEHRNADLPQIREQYNQPRDSEGNVTPMLHDHRSRASSLNRSVASGRAGDSGEGSSTPPKVRGDTLEVPTPVHHSPTRHHSNFSFFSDLHDGVKEKEDKD